MKILLCHTFYQKPGGEDLSFAAEEWLLRQQGHEVVVFAVSNAQLESMSRLRAAGKTIWNVDSYQALRGLIRRERPALMHCTNTFPLLSPSIYYAARIERVPVVQALRNYRLLCPNALFYRDGRPCELCCRSTSCWPGVRFGCYRQSRGATAVVAAMLNLHRWLRTWERCVAVYYTLTSFARNKFVAAGFCSEQVRIKPNFVQQGFKRGTGRGGFAVLAGRLTEEKGVCTVLEAWERLPIELPLKIVGAGPLVSRIEEAAAKDRRIEFLGWKKQEETMDIIGDAAFLIAPSKVYETFGRTIIEAYAVGTPVVAARLGAMHELVRDGETGALFEPGCSGDLGRVVEYMWKDPRRLNEMRDQAHQEYENHYTPEANYAILSDIYRQALQGF